jgi:PAS domain S-box-containing protein
MFATTESSDVMYRLLVQGVIDYAICMLKPDGTVANWNAGAQRAKGYSADEIVGRHFSCFYSADDQAAGLPTQGLATALREGRFEAHGMRYRKDGSSFWAHVIIDAIKAEDGNLIGFGKVTRDVTERVQYENDLLGAKDLAESHSKEMAALSIFLDSVISNIPSAVLVQDAVSRQVLLVNLQAERLFEGQREVMIGQRVEDCLPTAVVEYVENLVDQCLRREGLHTSQTQLQTGRGLRTLRSRAMTIRGQDAKSSYVLLIADDVTDETVAQAQIQHMAHHDSLTGLPNRRLFAERLSDTLRAGWERGQLTAVLCLDLDNFKNVNDALGHQYGDLLLREIPGRLRQVLRDHDRWRRVRDHRPGPQASGSLAPHWSAPDRMHRTAVSD